MRGSGWLLLIVASLLWLAAVGGPLIGGAAALADERSQRLAETMTGGTMSLTMTTAGWALAVTLGALILGWWPGTVLGRLHQRRGAIPVAVLYLVPMCLPSYLVFYAWWQSWPQGSFLAEWAARTDRTTLLRECTLWVGLVCWSWPIVAWCVAGAVSSVGAQHEEQWRLDGVSAAGRFIARVRLSAGAMLLGGLIVFLIIFNETTSFDVAQVRTVGFELRAVDAGGGGARDVMAAGWPAVAVAVAGSAVVWFSLQRSREPLSARPVRVGRSHAIATVFIWTASVAIPITLLLVAIRSAPSLSAVLDAHGEAIGRDGALSLLTGLLAALVAFGSAAAWMDRRRWVRGAATAQALGWVIAAALPAIVVALAIEAAYNSSDRLAEVVYLTPAVMVIGRLARFGFVGALLGRWLAGREEADLRALRELDGAATLRGLVQTSWPRWLAVGTGVVAIVSVLSLSEVVVTGRVQPPQAPSREPMAQILLNSLHYQRHDLVVFMGVVLIGLAVLAGTCVALAWGALRRPRALGLVVSGLLVSSLIVGCDDSDGSAAGTFRPTLVFGGPGRSLGQFEYPRAIDADPDRKVIYVVDKTARIQRFGFDGEPQLEWRMPRWENGKPTGISVAPDGRVFVADTHEHRVMAFDPDGRPLMQFGEYGVEPGQFIYPTDVAFGPQGRIYVSEYGGNDRIQVFDADGGFLFQFGGFGDGPGQFNRPQSMVFSRTLTELYVADSCNHRIVVTDPEGTVLRAIGGPGTEPGELRYPYGTMMLEDGSLLIAEFGNNRVQRLTPEGESLGIYGRTGRNVGELASPWGIAGDDATIFVLDSRNNRVQVMNAP